MEAELKRIGRKARRFIARNKVNKKACFVPFDNKNLGRFLRPNFDLSPV